MTEVDRSAEVEDLVDSVELLVEAVREVQREKATLKAQEKLVAELVGETKALVAQLEAEPTKPPKPTGTHRNLPESMGNGGLNLKSRRVQLSLSQSALGAKVGVTGAHISQVENGRVRASSELLQRIHTVLGIPHPS